MVRTEHSGDTTRLYLVPNRSATWRQTKFAIALAAAATLTVAGAWSVLGFWLILPFAGLEVALLACLSYRVCSATYHQQVVLFGKENVDVQWGSHYPKRRWRFKRADTRLEVVRPHHSLSPYRLHLRDSHQTLAIADQLNQQDVQQALNVFKSAGLPLRYSGTTSAIAVEGFDL